MTIWYSTLFWQQKTTNDFKVCSESPASTYCTLNTLYEKEPGTLILRLIKERNYAPVLDLIKKSRFITRRYVDCFGKILDISPVLSSILVALVEADQLEQIIAIINYLLGKVEAEDVDDFLTACYFEAIALGRTTILEYLDKFCHPIPIMGEGIYLRAIETKKMRLVEYLEPLINLRYPGKQTIKRAMISGNTEIVDHFLRKYPDALNVTLIRELTELFSNGGNPRALELLILNAGPLFDFNWLKEITTEIV
jgi:hypothetical protein